MLSSDTTTRVTSANAGAALGPPNDTECVPSFLRIYETYFTFVWSMSRYYGVRAADTDDVIQDIFIAVHRRLHTVERAESIRSWIYSILRRTISNYHRRRTTRPIEGNTVSLEGDTEADWYPPQTGVEYLEQANLLQKLLEKVDPAKREVLILRELGGMTAPEISEMLGVPLNTVYSRLRNARMELEAAHRRHNRGAPCHTSPPSSAVGTEPE